MSFTNQMPWGGVAGAPDGIVMVRTANFFTLLDGTPVNVLAGQSGSASVPPDMVWDWRNKVLYICTVSSGLAIDTVWTQVEFVGPFVGTDITSTSLTVTGVIQDQGTLNVVGGATFQAGVQIANNLEVDGSATVAGSLAVSGPLTALAGGTLGGVFTGNPLFNFNITPLQPIDLPNEVFIQSAATDGVYRRLIGTDSGNSTYVGNAGGNICGFINQGLSAWLLYCDNAGNCVIAGNLSVNGGEFTGSLGANYIRSNGNLDIAGSGSVGGTWSVGAGLYPNQGIVNIGGIPGFDMYNNGGASLLNFAANNYIQYNGNLNYQTTGTHIFNGNIQCNNGVFTTYVQSSGNIQAAGTYTGGAVSVSGGVTCTGVNAQGGQVAAGDVHSSGNIEADNSFNCQQNVHAGQGLFGAFLQTTGTSTHGWQFWDDGANAYIRKDATWDALIGTFSDARLKRDIAPADVDCLAALSRVELKQFRWDAAGPDSPLVPVGFITQQLREAFLPTINARPKEAPEGAEFFESVNVNVMLGLLVGAVQQLQAIIAERD